MSRPRRTTPPSTFFPLPSFKPEPSLPTANYNSQTHSSTTTTSTSPAPSNLPLALASIPVLLAHLSQNLRPWTTFFHPARLSFPTGFSVLGKGDVRRGVDAYLSRVGRNWRFYWANYAALCCAVWVLAMCWRPAIAAVVGLWAVGMVFSSRLEDPIRVGKNQTVPKSNVYFLVSSVSTMILYVLTGMGCVYPLSISGALVLFHSTFHKPPARSVVINAYNKRQAGGSTGRSTKLIDVMDDL